MEELNNTRRVRINSSQRFVLQARGAMAAAAHALTEASQLATNEKTGMRLANLARAANLTAECFSQIVRELAG
jgi:hypothetical protein